jgi:hypothetical protein
MHAKKNKSARHPDAAIFALAEQCAAVAKRLEKSREAVDQAEERCKHIDTPKALYRTARDAARKLFVGEAIGYYNREEIGQIRVLYRRLMREDVSIGADEFKTYDRCREIMETWADWNDRKGTEEARSGLTDALHKVRAISDEFDDVSAQLAKARASTIEGVLAKARGLRSAFREEEEIAEAIDTDLRRFGADDMIFGLSIARDLLALAEAADV